MKSSKINLLILLLVLGQSLMASNAPVLEKANEAFRTKKYEEAIAQYEQVLSEGQHGAMLYYNLGNAYYRNGNLGKAILNYERALLLNPRDADAQHNLAVAKSQQIDQIEEISEFFGYRYWNNLKMVFSSGAWSTLSLIFLWIGIAGVVLWLLSNDRKRKKLGFFGGFGLLMVSMFTYVLASSRIATEKNSGSAILLSESVSLRPAPDTDSKEILLLHEGVKLRLLDEIGDWHKVRLENGEIGWLPDESFEEI